MVSSILRQHDWNSGKYFLCHFEHTFSLAASFVSVSIQSAESRLLIKALRIRVVISCTWNKKKDLLTTSDANSSKCQSNYTWSVTEIKETIQKKNVKKTVYKLKSSAWCLCPLVKVVVNSSLSIFPWLFILCTFRLII